LSYSTPLKQVEEYGASAEKGLEINPKVSREERL